MNIFKLLNLNEEKTKLCHLMNFIDASSSPENLQMVLFKWAAVTILSLIINCNITN